MPSRTGGQLELPVVGRARRWSRKAAHGVIEGPGKLASKEPALQIASVAWERIQIVLDLRTEAPAGSFDAVQVWLETVNGRRTIRVAPSEVERHADGLRVHFNVMAGQEQMPLDPGRWVVVAGPDGSPPLRLAQDAAVDVATVDRTFKFPGGRYDVRVAIEPGSRVLSFATDSMRRKLRRGWLSAACIAIARRTVRRTGRRIVFAGGGSPEARNNLRGVRDRMVARGLDREYDLVYTHGKQRGSRKEGARSRFSTRALWRMTRQVAGADVIVATGSLHAWAGVISPSPGTRYIQLWHAAGAFKTCGYSRVGKPRGPSPYLRLHKDYTHVVVSAEAIRPYFAEAFSVPIERVVALGVPRTDRFFDPDLRAASQALARRTFPMTEGRMTILVAPTFRGSGGKATYDHTQIDWAAFHALAVERNAVVLFKMHPFVRTPLPIPEELGDRLIDATRTTIEANDLLLIVDLLISDYSTIIYEFSTLGRPMLFFAYDLDEYIAARDVYEPYESFVPGRIVRTFPELLDAIRRDDYEVEKVAPFAARAFTWTDGRSTDRVIDELILAR